MPIAACCLALACSRQRPPLYEEPPPPQRSPAAENTPAPDPQDVPPPRAGEISSVVKRVFGDAAVGDTGGQGRFIVGDFNGDLSQDIAVVVKPVSGSLEQMNEQPRWLLQDPRVPADATQPLKVAASEELLAIIHGNGPGGWRDPDATQTYLLKNAVGSNLTVHRGREFVAANRGRRLPRIQGDLIGEVLQGASGYLYYTGPTYAWYDPKTFTGEPQGRLVHGRPKDGLD